MTFQRHFLSRSYVQQHELRHWLLSMRILILIVLLIPVACNTKQPERTIPSKKLPDTLSKNSGISAADALISGERIDGPANIRDTVNGKLLFVLNDNVVVSSTLPKHKWLRLGIIADLTQEQIDCSCMTKGADLFSNGLKVGTAVEDIHLTETMKTNEGWKTEVIGYTAVSNLRKESIAENALSDIINLSPDSLTIADFQQFIQAFQFSKSGGLLKGTTCFQIDENWIDDPSPLLRLLLLFKEDKFYGVFHSRPLTLREATTTKVNRDFYWSSFHLDAKTNEQIVNVFNAYIVQMD